MENMIFPRDTLRVGNCLAVKNKDGEAILHPYLGVCYLGGGKKRWAAHRLSYHLNIKPIERSPASRTNNLILHSCHNKWCVNPEHLYLGTQKQNMADVLVSHPDRLNKISKSKTGSKATETTKNKMSSSRIAWLRHNEVSEETKQKISASQTNYWRKIKSEGVCK